ncbi:MAG: EamA family transporter [Rhodobacteraceae bacterium]|nr:MAG: EamA family transporter [Paracoccaceae bacterium]
MNNSRGILLMLFSMLTFAIHDAFIKGLQGIIPVSLLIFLMGIFGAVFFICTCLITKQRPFSASFFNKAIIARNLGEVFGAIGIASSIQATSLSATSAIQQLVPTVVTLGAVIFLGQTIGWRRWAAIVFGFFCVMLIIKPGMNTFAPTSLWALMGVAGLSLRDIATKRIKVDISAVQLSVYAYVTLIPAGALLILIMGDSFIPNPQGYPMLAGTIVFSLLAYVSITLSIQMSDITVVIPFRYTRLLFALIFGFVFFAERPDVWTLVGAAGIIVSGIFLMIRERDISPLSSTPTTR